MQNSGIKRVFLIVLDSFGCGSAPDAAEFGDAATCSTLRSVTESGLFPAANLTRLGLYNIEGIQTGTPDAAPIGAHARLRELSRGKDTTIGHWEMAGIVKNEPMPTYPDGFPPDVIAQLEAAFGRKILCNKPYSSTRRQVRSSSTPPPTASSRSQHMRSTSRWTRSMITAARHV